MSDPMNPGEITVTIKYGKGYEESWAVFRGAPETIKANVGTYFGLDGNDYDTLHDLTVEATRLAHAVSTVASQAGGRVMKKSEQAKEGDSNAAGKQADPSPAPEPEKADEPDPVLVAIEGAKSRDDLKRIYAENKDRFKAEAPLMDAYKARGKSLPA